MIRLAKNEIARILSEASGAPQDVCLASLEPTEEKGHGDLASKIGFILAKERKTSPGALAHELSKKIKPHEWIEKIEANGPYLNFFFSDAFYSAAIERILEDGPNYGKGRRGKRVIIEFPSVNPNKPWHVGHLRNALMGDSVANLLEFAGDKVQRIDYIDDLGLQVAQSLWGFDNLGKKPEGKFDHWLGGEYVEVSERMERDPETVKFAEGLLHEMEEGDNEVARKARWLAEECVKAQYQTAFEFGIYHDALICESDVLREIFAEGMGWLRSSGAVELEKEGKNTGCWLVCLGEKMKGMEDPDKILIRSNGTATYTGKDVIFQLWKFGKLHGNFFYSKFIAQPNGETAYITSAKGNGMDFGKAEIVVNVIGVEQKYPQEVIRHVFDSLGLKNEADNSVHLSYEHAWLPEAKFSGRKGTWLGYTTDELVEEGKKRAEEKVKLEFSEKDKKEIASKVAIGAIRYAFLKIAPEKKLIFKWDEVLSMEGDSGPYLQYACVRAKRIMEKAEFLPQAGMHEFNPAERELILELASFPEMVDAAAEKMKPHLVSSYLYNLSNLFSKFYTTNRVLDAETKEIAQTRLAMVRGFESVLSKGLGILGVPIPDKM